eukprot:210067_1
MSHRDFVKFLKTLQIRSKKEERFSALKGISSDAWKGLINKFDALQMTEGAFNGMSKKQFGSTLKRTLGTGYIVKIHKIMSEELIRIQKDKFFTTKERIEDCDNIEILKLLLAVLREIDAIDIENDLNINLLAQLLGNNINGKEFLNFDEEYIINEFIMKSLYRKFSYINAHRFGKRFRYWPAYSDNKTSDLLNGFFTHHWYVRPKFNDIKEEILNNQICSITVNQWNRTVLFASKVIIRTVFIKKLKAIVEINKKDGGSTSNSSYNKYGVKNNDRIRLEHLVPLLIYINLDFVSKQLILTYNNNNNYIHNKYSQWIKYMKNHSQLSHLARLVRETVECYGEISTNKNQMTFYHLVDKSIPSSSLHTRFFSPTSVTTSLNTAFILNDFNDNEIIFELKCNQQSNLKYFNCSFLSDFPNEHEYIICGGLGTAKITNIYDLCLSQNYIYYIKAIEILFNIMNNQKPNDDKYDNNTMQKIGKCLNSLMQIRYKINKDKNVNVNDIINNEENTYIHNMFNQICNNIDYAQINLNYVLLSPLMKAVLLNNRNNSIRFDVLTSIFTNIQKYYIILKDIKININDIIFNENIIKFIQQKEIKSIKFSYVDQKIKSNDNFKNYKEKFMKHGYQLNYYTFTNNKFTTLCIDNSIDIETAKQIRVLMKASCISDQDLEKFRKERHVINIANIIGSSNTKKVDYLLGKCYESYGKDYYDGNNNGKFIAFVKDNGMDTDIIMEQLEYDIDSNENKLIKFGVEDFNYYPNEAYEVIKCFYKYNRLPTLPSIDNLENMASKKHILKWSCVALKHELYPKISDAFMQIVTQEKHSTVDKMLEALNNKLKLDGNEIKYVEKLIQRAVRFSYSFTSYVALADNNPEQKEFVSIKHRNVMHELSSDMLMDIYNVHNSFLFMNFNFQQYEEPDIMQHIE